MQKIVIFGSTGATGLGVIEAAINRGLNVRAFVRNPTKLPGNLKNKVEIAKGNVVNYDEVLEAVQNTDAVVVALGTRNDLKPTTVMSEGLKNIVRAMKEANLAIISVCLSEFLFHGPKSNKVPGTFRDITDEHQRMFDVLKESGLNYIAVFAPYFTGQPASSYEVAHNKYLGPTVSTYDLGNFLVNSLTEPEHYGQVCGIKSK